MRLGSIVPNFKAETTKGLLQFYDWQADSWVLFFSHPADFTPVCTTEIGRLAVRQKEFEQRNVKCLAHSVDKLENHMAWLVDVKSYCMDVPPPIIADSNRELAVQLGLLDEESQKNPANATSVRGLYIIGPDHTVRLSIFYPSSVGRNIDEIFRVIDALQLTDKLKTVATPVNWTPGSKIMILPEISDAEIKRQFGTEFETISMPSGKNYMKTISNFKEI